MYIQKVDVTIKLSLYIEVAALLEVICILVKQLFSHTSQFACVMIIQLLSYHCIFHSLACLSLMVVWSHSLNHGNML